MNYYLASYVILGLGLVLCLGLILYSRGKRKGIKHYEEMRDKLTTREPEIKEAEEEPTGGFSIGSIMGAIVVLIVGLSLIPEVSKQVNIAQFENNITGASSTILGMTSVFFALAIVFTAISLVIGGLRKAGEI